MSTMNAPKTPTIQIWNLEELPTKLLQKPTLTPTLPPTTTPAKKSEDKSTETLPGKNYNYNGNGIVSISGTSKSLGDLLRKYCVEEGVDGNGKFWTNVLLRHILTPERIKNELKKPVYGFDRIQVDDYVYKIHPSSENNSAKAYIKVFALLALMNRVRNIRDFITEGVNDEVLPIVLKDGCVCPQRNQERRLECFDEWDTHEQEYFESSQWMVDTPYFDSTKAQTLTEVTFSKSTHKPWCMVREPNSKKTEGAYGTVIQVKIHPTAHSYQPFLESIGLDCATFAIKTLRDIPANTEHEWKKEWDMLKHFSGLNHPHLVTALSAFIQKEKLSFIFPFAPSNLEDYLTSHPPQDRDGAIWISAQLAGLIGAIDTIHDPKHLHLDPTVKKKYGRHSDIKCDNVLCFHKSGIAREATFVITDFGLATLNGDQSRSNIPNRDVPPVPGYRPPECDIADGKVSRAFDIWTLGCLFLELVTWFLGGPDYVTEFQSERSTMFINGSKNDIFFAFENLKSENTGGAKAILVKPEVTAWIYKLRQHQDCSPFLHQTLDIIEQEMLVVLSKEKKRSSSGPLRRAFSRISDRCKSEEKYTRGRPWTEGQVKEVQEQVAKSAIAVRAFPSSHAKSLLSLNQLELPLHKGDTKLSFDRDDFKKLESEL